jgi:hypothetical protein
MFECIGGLRDFSKANNDSRTVEGGEMKDDTKPNDEGCFGCILADDMVRGFDSLLLLLWSGAAVTQGDNHATSCLTCALS